MAGPGLLLLLLLLLFAFSRCHYQVFCSLPVCPLARSLHSACVCEVNITATVVTSAAAEAATSLKNCQLSTRFLLRFVFYCPIAWLLLLDFNEASERDGTYCHDDEIIIIIILLLQSSANLIVSSSINKTPLPFAISDFFFIRCSDHEF